MKRIVFFILPMMLAPLFVEAQSTPKWKKWEVLGDTAFSKEDYKSAIKHYSKAIKVSKLATREDYQLLYKRALANLNFGFPDKSVTDIDLFLEQYPLAYQGFIFKAYLHATLDQPDEALLALTKALAINPENPDVIKWRAEILLDIDRSSEAISELLGLPKQYRDPQTEVMLGMAYYQMEKNDSAFYYLNQALRMDPFYYPALRYSASLHLEESEFDLALAYINRALVVDSTDPFVYFLKGAILAEQDDLDEACRCLNRAFYNGIDDAGDYLKQYCFN